MSTPRESIDCAGCPACVWAEKERAAARGERCRICLTTFDELWPVQSESQPDLCRRCASATPSGGRGDTFGRFDPLTATESHQMDASGGTTAEKPGETP
jgi:hypothetical protein